MPSPDKKTIAVLWHEAQQRERTSYMISHYAEVWREDGHQVIDIYGPNPAISADILIVHVDLSVVPDPYLQFAARFPIVLNGKVRDIRKSTVSTLRVLAKDPWPGPVIVKSDLNFAGIPERRLNGSTPARNGPTMKSPNDYRVFDRIAAVPPMVWTDPNVVVERFMPQMEGGEYVIHNMVFLGERATCTKNFSKHPVIHAYNQSRTSWVEPHPEVLGLRKKLGFDMGKFDYVICAGKPVVFDTNKTVGAQPGPTSPEQQRVRRQRAEGLYAYFEKHS
jgi:hypothetical protein